MKYSAEIFFDIFCHNIFFNGCLEKNIKVYAIEALARVGIVHKFKENCS
jgi:hypothetical protein